MVARADAQGKKKKQFAFKIMQTVINRKICKDIIKLNCPLLLSP